MLRIWIILVLSVGTAAVPAKERLFDFSDDAVNEAPSGFRSVLSGSGEPGKWRIVLDQVPSLFAPISSKSTTSSSRHVLAQLSKDKTSNRYPMLVFEEEAYEDFILSTSFKIVEGETEQMAGVAFRIQDENNYYYIRASALGTNLSFFKMVQGQLVERVAANVEIPLGAWQELRIECRGNQFRGTLNGKELLLVTDTSTKDYYKTGKIGYWTKSDSVSYFADTRIAYTTKEIFAQVLIRDVVRRYPHLLGLRIYTIPPGETDPRVIASYDPQEVGLVGNRAERDAIQKNMAYYGKIKKEANVTLPLHDKNGEPIAAVRVIMKSFSGQTEKNALVRALPIVKKMEFRVPTLDDLMAN